MALNKIIEYFDLQSRARGRAKLEGRKADGGGDSLTVYPQYFALVGGIIAQPYFEQYQQTKSWALDLGAAGGWIAFAVIVGLLVFPSVYRRSFDAGQPKFVQFCAIFASGMGWKTLLDTAKGVAVAAGLSS
jgi:hypothetical protein